MWITSMGNHRAAGGISERRRSSCSSFFMDPFTQIIHGHFTGTGQSYGCPSDSEVTLRDIGKIDSTKPQ